MTLEEAVTLAINYNIDYSTAMATYTPAHTKLVHITDINNYNIIHNIVHDTVSNINDTASTYSTIRNLMELL